MQSVLLLIALGFGFKIFAEASEKQKKPIKQLGRLVGIIIMIVSLCGVLCSIFACMKGSPCGPATAGYCPTHGSEKGMMGFGHYGMKKDKAMCPLFGSADKNAVSDEAK